jgi:signal transduction histidine kinase
MSHSQAGRPDHFLARVVCRFLVIFLPIALLASAAILAVYAHDLDAESTLHEQAGWHITDLHATIIDREMEAIQGDILYLADIAPLRDYLSGKPGARRLLEEEFILFCRRKGIYDQIRYLDRNGREQVRINRGDRGQAYSVPEAELQSKAGRYYFDETMRRKRGEVFISPFDLNVEHEQIERPLKPAIRFATPVFDRDGQQHGILVLNFLGEGLLLKLSEVSVPFTGSTWLLNRTGHFLRGPSREDEWGFMLGHGKTLATYYPEEWAFLLSHNRRQFRTEHGLFTFREVRSQGRIGGPADPESPPSDPDARDPGLIVIAHVPSDVLQARSESLLHRLLLFSGVGLLLLLVLSWYLAYVGVLRRGHERQLAESEARLRLLSTRLMSAQEEERRSLARDLHDGLGQVVTAVTLDLERAAQTADHDKKDELIGRALTGAGQVLEQIHEITTRVRPTLLDDLGLKAAVQSFLSEYEAHTGIVVRSELLLDGPLPAAVSENLYRVLQEALTNVARHARAAEVFVTLKADKIHAMLAVRDEGAGFNPDALDGTRFGLVGMRERAELLGGTFDLRSQPGVGTAVSVAIPIRSQESGVRSQ